jgi:hypothetical protein
MQLISINSEHWVLYNTLVCRLMDQASALKLTQVAVFGLSAALDYEKVECKCENTAAARSPGRCDSYAISTGAKDK